MTSQWEAGGRRGGGEGLAWAAPPRDSGFSPRRDACCSRSLHVARELGTGVRLLCLRDSCGMLNRERGPGCLQCVYGT